mmetsp:Transcript_6594/g.17224  ORF Transcript_6594/g.17224 Transcript_6594/m.17224 type:complete len:349 (+) Transcript_6594:34-1080(+)
MWLLLSCLAAAAAQDWGDVESFLAPPSDVVSPQGLIIIRRSTWVSTVDEDEEVTTGGGNLLWSLLSLVTQPDLVLSRYDDDDVSHEDSAAQDFECPCGKDVSELCQATAAVDDYGDFATVYDKRLCLARQRGRISRACAAHLAEAPTVVEYCYDDIERSCGDVKPGQNRVHDCLAQATTLYSPCVNYLRSVVDKRDDPVTNQFDDIIKASFDLVKTLLDDDDRFLGPDSAFLAPSEQHVHQQHLLAPPVVPDEEVEEVDSDGVEVVEDDVDVDVAKETTTTTQQQQTTKAKALARALRLGVAALGALAAFVGLLTLLRFAARKANERQAKIAFQRKFAPLLVEAETTA